MAPSTQFTTSRSCQSTGRPARASAATPAGIAMALTVALLVAACSFDDSRLANLRGDRGLPDLADDAGQDVPTDLAADPDLSPDLPPDLSPDLPIDQGDDGVEDPVDDPTDRGNDPIEDPTEDPTGDPEVDPPVDGADDAVDTAGDPDAEPEPNQPPVITLPATPTVEGFLSVAVTGITFTDPDVGDGLLRLTIEPLGGVVSLTDISGSLVFAEGDGDRDTLVDVQGPISDLQKALETLVYHATVDGPVTGAIEITIDDQGNTGAGGPQSDTDTLNVTIEARQFDFEVQRGTFVMADGSSTASLEAGTDYTAPTGEAFVRVVNTRLAGMGRTSGGQTRGPDHWMVVVDATTDLSSEIVFRRTEPTDNCRITWELIDYTGDAEGGNAWVVHDLGVATFGTEDESTAVDVSGVTVDEDVVVFMTGQLTSSSLSADTNLGLATSEWDGDMDDAVFTRSDSGTGAEVSYAVVEMTGDNWSVNWLEHTYTAAGVAEPQNFSPSINLERAFLHVQHRTGGGGNRETGALAWLGAINAMRFELRSGSAELDTAATVAWIIANSQTGEGAMFVEHVEGTNASGGDEEEIWTETLTQPVLVTERASVMGECATAARSQTEPPVGSIDLQLAADDTVELRQSESRDDMAYRFSVVQWPDE